MLDLIVRGLATFYLATAGVMFFEYLFYGFNYGKIPRERALFLMNKPFNCELCLSFWFALLVGLSFPFMLTDYAITVFAIAGISILWGAIYDRLRMYIS